MFKWKTISLSTLLLSVFMLSGCNIKVLNPQGPVAEDQFQLILWSLGFMLFIVLVVFSAFTIILVRYRDRPGHQNHDPEQEGNKWLELLWTVIPIIIIICLAVPTVRTIYALEDPPKQSKDQEPLTVRVVSSDWKWIFVYPEQGIETVNYLNIPADVPIKFRLTSAGSMSSLWIPSLGGQEYAMAGMMTQLILEADHPGTYVGKNANFNGKLFQKMKFNVHAMTREDFQAWAEKVKKNAPKLTKEQYLNILEPGVSAKKTFSSTHLSFVNHVKEPDFAVKHTEILPPH
ncbi:MAG TPA: cytochrome aa3 quinol oxidase subunit II [Bacillales bacterium]|nr:cytochrome aa3 quinol oxidase subunit II [Bacillales bacterium]